jgi:hypothetical protein
MDIRFPPITPDKACGPALNARVKCFPADEKTVVDRSLPDARGNHDRSVPCIAGAATAKVCAENKSAWLLVS